MRHRHLLPLLLAAAFSWMSSSAPAQNPVQWGGNARTAIDLARQHQMPLLFWITDWGGQGYGANDLADAQEIAFRDPTIVAIIKRSYVPVRVARNSNVLKEAAELGLPTNYGRYLAIITPDGKLIEQIDPVATASIDTLAKRLAAAYRTYCTDLYNSKLRPLIIDDKADKEAVRAAVQTVYRLNIAAAGPDLIFLCDRPDVTAAERARLYSLLAALGTKPCIDFLLDRASASGKFKDKPADKDAAGALFRADAGSLEHLLPALPNADDQATPRQVIAFTAAARIARVSTAPSESWWQKQAKPADRAKELDNLKAKADSVLEYWRETEGNWR